MARHFMLPYARKNSIYQRFHWSTMERCYVLHKKAMKYRFKQNVNRNEFIT